MRNKNESTDIFQIKFIGERFLSMIKIGIFTSFGKILLFPPFDIQIIQKPILLQLQDFTRDTITIGRTMCSAYTITFRFDQAP